MDADAEKELMPDDDALLATFKPLDLSELDLEGESQLFITTATVRLTLAMQISEVARSHGTYVKAMILSALREKYPELDITDEDLKPR